MEIEGFCCDAPALSFIKCIKSCKGYFGYMKCETKRALKKWEGREGYLARN
jgi:hypothetical protein